MGELLSILVNISLPILLLIATGYGFQKIFKTDVRTFIKLQIYLLVPGMVFIRILESGFTMSVFFTVAAYTALLMIGLFAISRLYSAIARFPRSTRNATANLMMLINTGNYGFPLIDLVFLSNPIATASQLIIVLLQNITSSTVSVYQASAGRVPGRKALLNILRMPVLYAMVLGAIVRLVPLISPKWSWCRWNT